MKKWSGGVLVGALTVILVLRYSFISKAPQKQSAYDFFNGHVSEKANLPQPSSSKVDYSNTSVLALLNFKGKPSFLQDVEGIASLYSSTRLLNFSQDESEAMLVWALMRFLLLRSDALPETAQGVKEAALSWEELSETIREIKVSKFEAEERQCPYFATEFIGTRGRSSLQIPCGLVEDSSVTVIGIPDAEMEGFQIELLGSKYPNEANPPVILQYKVFLPGQNLSKEPFVVQNSWTNASGWGKDEKCPDHSHSSSFVEVDGLVKCSAQIGNASSQLNSEKLSNVSGESGHVNANFPYVEGIPFTASLWIGPEGFHMTVNGRHETSFAYREKLEPWLVSGVKVKGGLDTVAILAKGLPVSGEQNLEYDLELLKAPPVLKKRVILLIGVFSTANNFARRMALRRSWMQYEAIRAGNVAVRFFIGLHKNKKVNFELWKEAQSFRDIQLMPFVDYYSLLSLKTIAICILGTEILPAKYIMKTDDDAFVRVDEVLSRLKVKPSDSVLFGHMSYESSPHRDKDNKWHISAEEWPYKSFPPWAHGPGYIMSRDIAKFVVRGHRERELMLFKLEDVAVGIWIEIYKYKNRGREVMYMDEERFYINGCEDDYILAHYQTPRMVLCLWENLQKNNTECCE